MSLRPLKYGQNRVGEILIILLTVALWVGAVSWFILHPPTVIVRPAPTHVTPEY